MLSQIAIFFVIAAVASSSLVGPLGGVSHSSRKQDDFGNYAFNYQIKDGHGATNGRSEAGNPHGVVGSYNLADIDGRARRVDYVADGKGFRAVVKTNEPGTAASLPAAVAVASPYHGNFASSAYGKAAVVNSGPAYGYAAGYGVGGYGVAGHGAYGLGDYGFGGYGGYGNGGYGLGGYGGYGGYGLGGYGGYGHGGYGLGGYGGYGGYGLGGYGGAYGKGYY